MKEEKHSPLSVFTKKFWEKNLILIPGVCSQIGIGLSLLFHVGRYNLDIGLMLLAIFIIMLFMQKHKILYKIYCYIFTASSSIMFLLICTFRLTFKAPCFLSLSDWINVLLIWFVIFISTIALDLASAKLSNNS